MLVGMLEDGTTDAILSGRLGMGKGMLYEALIADALYKRGGEAAFRLRIEYQGSRISAHF